jgi:hypothetical protein
LPGLLFFRAFKQFTLPFCYLNKKDMKRNVGKADSIMRIIVAVVAAALFFTDQVTGTWGYVLLAVAAVMLITAITGFCGLYRLFGMGTCRMKSDS